MGALLLMLSVSMDKAIDYEALIYIGAKLASQPWRIDYLMLRQRIDD
jgi:hypothetical protein